MRKLALSQKDMSQAGTEPVIDSFVHSTDVDTVTVTEHPAAAAHSMTLVHVSSPSDIERGFGIIPDTVESPARFIDVHMADKWVSDAERQCLPETMGSRSIPECVSFHETSPTNVGNTLSEDIISTPMQLSFQHGSECSTQSPEGMLFSQSPPCSIGNTLFDDIDWSPVHCAQIDAKMPNAEAFLGQNWLEEHQKSLKNAFLGILTQNIEIPSLSVQKVIYDPPPRGPKYRWFPKMCKWRPGYPPLGP